MHVKVYSKDASNVAEYQGVATYLSVEYVEYTTSEEALPVISGDFHVDFVEGSKYAPADTIFQIDNEVRTSTIHDTPLSTILIFIAISDLPQG